MDESDVIINKPGVRAVLKSIGVKELLRSVTDAACARCNSLYRLESDPTKDPYRARVEDHRVVSVGQVYTNTRLSAEDNLRNNTLKKGTGW